MTNDVSLRTFDAPSDRIRMHVQGARRPVLVVEGATDAQVLGDLLDGQAIVPVGSRANVLTTAGDLLRAGVRKFVAVFDVDFTPVPFGEGWDAVLYPYDGRDLESMLINHGALHRLLRYKGSAAKIDRHGGIDGLVAELVALAEPVTRLRAESARSSLGLRFDAVDFGEKIDLTRLVLSLELYCVALAKASDRVVTASVLKAIAEDDSNVAGAARGKDVLVAASRALRRVAGSLPKAACDPDILAMDLLAASALILRESDWFVALERRLLAA